LELLDLDGVLDLRRLRKNANGVQPVRDILRPRITRDCLDAQGHRFIKGGGGDLNVCSTPARSERVTRQERSSIAPTSLSSSPLIRLACDYTYLSSRRPDQAPKDAEWIDSERLRDLQELDDVEPSLAAFELRDVGLRPLEPFCERSLR
jgi:hypothetical protein